MGIMIATVNDLEDALKELENEDLISCDTETTELDIRKASLQGIGFGTDKKQWFIPFPNNIDKYDIIERLGRLFHNKKVIFHNAKYDLQVLAHNKFPIPKEIHDTMIMSWLVDENSGHGLKQLARDLFGKEPKTWEELNKQPDLFRTEEDVMNELGDYCMEDVANTHLLYFHFLPLLKAEALDIAYERVEVKLIPLLCAMEMRGIKIDTQFLNERHNACQIALQSLERAIVEKIKERTPEGYPPINIRSNQQMSDVMFNVFKYKAEKITNTGKNSTDAEALDMIIAKEKLTEEDFLPMLLQFRDLDKVDNTYFVALAEQGGLDSTLHCNFKQHGTRTGRLSSSDPNLQNIPSRNDEWNVRKSFIPRDGYKFLMADYSQLELRIMAHFSKDPTMVDTFQKGGDIHAETMKAIGSNRHTAKTINFGLIYGMGPRTLARDLHIKEDDAKKYINRFFHKYQQVKNFIDRTQTLALRNGYVDMITGRRRHFTEVADKKWWNMIARQAVNTKIQGSASDLVKVAMIKLHPQLKKIGANILVQIHDEVLVEVPDDKIEEAKKVLYDTMENALKFNVPMVVNITQGDRWVKE